jgi:hypothetical protein
VTTGWGRKSRAPLTVTRGETTRLDETGSREERKGRVVSRIGYDKHCGHVVEKEIEDDGRTESQMYSRLSIDGAGGRILDVE